MSSPSEVSAPLLPRRTCFRRLQAILTADYFPQADRVLRRLVWNPLGGLLLATTVAFVCAFFLHPRAFVLAFGLLAVLLLGVGWPWISLRPLRGVVAFGSDRVREGESVEVLIEVINAFPASAFGILVGEAEITFAGLPVVPGWRTTRQTGVFTPSRRGEYPRSALHLRTAFPFGLFKARRTVKVERPCWSGHGHSRRLP